MKQCRTCKDFKSVDEFAVQSKHGWRGTSSCVRPDCKFCVAAKAREYRKTYKHQGGSYRTNVDKKLYAAVMSRVSDAKARAIKSGYEFSLTKDEMYDLALSQNMTCAITGFKLGLVKREHDVLSIDKIDPSKGYILANVQWVQWSANRAKGDLSNADFLAMCRAVVRCNDYPEREYTQVSGSASPSIDG